MKSGITIAYLSKGIKKLKGVITFVLALYSIPAATCFAQTNLVKNGDFSLTDPNDLQSPYFDTEYSYDTNLQPEGRYVIGTNPRDYHNNFCNMTTDSDSPLSGGNMLIANADAVSSKKIWAQTVSVKPNTNYTFSFYAASLASGSNGQTNLMFGVYVDCKRMGNDIVNSSNCNWVQYSIQMYSGNLSSIELAIRNLSTEKSGNDIAIDDISFVETTSSTTFPSLGERVWRGYSTDWFQADNWGSCTVPTCGDNVTIPAGLTNYPIITSGTNASTQIANVGSITIASGASLTLNQYSELQVCGNLINDGTITTNSSATVTLSGTGTQNISGTFTNLKINKATGAAILTANTTVSETLNLTNGLIKTGLHELIVTNSASNAIVSSSKNSYVVGNLRRSVAKITSAINPGFEMGKSATQTPIGWNTWASGNNNGVDYTETYSGAHTGDYHLTHYNNAAYEVVTYQQFSSISNGTYTLKAWVKSGGGQTYAYMYAKGYGTNVPELQSTNMNYNVGNWTQITISNIKVTNNYCEIGFYSKANAYNWFYMDDVEFYKDSPLDYTYPVGDAFKYQPIKMTLKLNKDINSILGAFYSESASGTAGLPIVESGNKFDELGQGGYWHLTPDVTPTAVHYDLELFFDQIPNSNDAITLVKRHDSNSNWTLENSINVGDYSPKSSMSRVGFNSFSEYTVVGAEMVILPVENFSLSGKFYSPNNIELNWLTTSQVNVKKYVIERSNDGLDFNELSEVLASKISSNSEPYKYFDQNPYEGNNYYRVKAIDFDNTFTYSKIIMIYASVGQSHDEFTIYPNPVIGNKINLSANYNGKAEVRINHPYGQAELPVYFIEFNNNTVQLDLPELQQGIYIVTIVTDTKIYNQKLMIR